MDKDGLIIDKIEIPPKKGDSQPCELGMLSNVIF